MNADALYRDHARTVLRWVIRLGGPLLDAQDTSHEVFAVALARLHTFHGGSEPAWLYGITRRVVANARRRARLRQFFGLGSAPPPLATDPAADEVLERLQQRRIVQEILDELSDLHREALVLVDLEGRAAPEVAEMLGISVGTVYSRVHHARRGFARALADRGHEVKNGLVQRVLG